MNIKKFLACVMALALVLPVTSAVSDSISNSVVASADNTMETDAKYFEFSYDDDDMTAGVSRYLKNGPTDVVIPSTVTVTDDDGEEKVYTVTYLNNYAFSGNTFITSVVVPDTVILMDGYNTFEGCQSLKSVTLGNGLRNITTNAFENCTSLTSVNIPNSVTEISGSAFKGCTSLESITVPDSVVLIGDSAFSGCASLKEATVSNSITVMSMSMFSGCTALEDVNISDSATTISNGTFRGCDALKSLTIPTSVTEINLYAFENTELTDIYYQGTEDDWNDIYFTGSGSLDGITIHYKEEEPIVIESPKGDLTGDGKVNVLDLLKLKKYILGIIDTLD
jgi:hypothetical protein